MRATVLDTIRIDPEDVAALDPIRTAENLEYFRGGELWEILGRDRRVVITLGKGFQVEDQMCLQLFGAMWPVVAVHREVPTS
jgi:hypothetical protein